MNIFYGVIILNLEELTQQKEQNERKSQGSDSQIKLENELHNIREQFERSRATARRFKGTIAAVEIDELSIEHMITIDKAENPTEDE